ncbi:MAG: metalloregulator ArsR/SmtB family transcription factor [Candidatus Omnitrophica bacterium]|nr:metalloregulator ArsR/SmtB family transcription factor [Candidatus Omnitrophota bacterium]MCF7887614.1 metalloregulator ArsR/SmtB family transcription factor [Candidatus Omnitrophota bacterium]
MKKLQIKDLEKRVKASADANRIRILSMLKGKKMCVCEIAFVLGITQPSVSRHLKKLKIAGFIASKNERLWTNYYLCPQNRYAKNFIKNLQLWTELDKIIAADKKKIKKADRVKLCCP